MSQQDQENQESQNQPQPDQDSKYPLISGRVKNLSPDKFMELWAEEKARFAQLAQLAEDKKKEKIKKEKAAKRTQRGQRLVLMGLALAAYLAKPNKTTESKKIFMEKLISAHESQQKAGTPEPTESQDAKNKRDIEILRSALEMAISGDLSDWKDAAPKDTTRKPKPEPKKTENPEPTPEPETKTPEPEPIPEPEPEPAIPEPKPEPGQKKPNIVEISVDEILEETQQQQSPERINAMSFED